MRTGAPAVLFGTVPVCRSCVVVVLCSTPWCISVQASSVYCYKTLMKVRLKVDLLIAGYYNLTCLCELLTCHWPFDIPSFYNIYYALLFYIPLVFLLLHPLSDFSDVDSQKLPPIYNSTDAL